MYNYHLYIYQILMRIFKSHPLLKLVNSYLVDSPQPSNINFLWNFGSLLTSCLIIQIITGVTLAMHYNTNVLEAFNSVEHIMRDVNNGWLLRYLHSNTASAFFFIVYLHIGRGLYYGSYKAPRTLVWTIGTVIFILMIATAFLGYVLPYGQMSLWGATVITSLMSAIPWVGQDVVEFLWGGFSVNNATLNRFFALHFVLPFILAALALMHLIVLHDSAGSGNPLGISGNYDRLPFAPYYIFKDLITFFIFILLLSMLVFFMPNLLGDSENYVMANAMQTPPAIVPEWYLLPFYAILRSIPNKLLGVIAMFSAILILLVMPFTDLSRSRGIQFKPLSKVAFYVFVCNFLILMELGAKHVESPFIEFGQISTVIYFAHFLIIVPLISLFENSLIELSTKFDDRYLSSVLPELHDMVLSGWWWEYYGYTLDMLVSIYNKPYNGRVEDFRGNDPVSHQDKIDRILALKRVDPKLNHIYDSKLKAQVREDGLVSEDRPLPENEHGNRKPWKWMTREEYFKNNKNGMTLEKYNESIGLDDKSIKEFEEGRKEVEQQANKYYEQKQKEYEERKELQQQLENERKEEEKKREEKKKKDDEFDRKHGRGPGDGEGGLEDCRLLEDGTLIRFWPRKYVLPKPKNRTINWEPSILILKYNMYALLGVLLFEIGLTLSLSAFSHISVITDFLTASPLLCDAPRPWGIYFQDSATPQMEGLVELHDNIFFYLVIILFGVGWLLISIVKKHSNTESPVTNKYLSHGTLVELIWTITPALILILIAFPSFKLLYLMDEVSDPAMAVLAEGHQWYWSYQYPDFLNSDDEFIEFDSYLIPELDLEEGALRMLEVDNRLIMPELTHVRFVTTGADVIHSLACPALGIKCDAYPGRLNQTSLMINRQGVFYGQCSEICGILHSSMPIVIESVSIGKFVTWLREQ